MYNQDNVKPEITKYDICKPNMYPFDENTFWWWWMFEDVKITASRDKWNKFYTTEINAPTKYSLIFKRDSCVKNQQFTKFRILNPYNNTWGRGKIHQISLSCGYFILLSMFFKSLKMYTS